MNVYTVPSLKVYTELILNKNSKPVTNNKTVCQNKLQKLMLRKEN